MILDEFLQGLTPEAMAETLENVTDLTPEELQDALNRRTPQIQYLETNELRNLEQNLSIYHSELISQNEELHKINEKLQESEQRYEDLFAEAPISYFVFDSEGYIITANRAFCQLLERTEPELRYAKLSQFLAPRSQDDYCFFLRGLEREFGTQKKAELTFVKHNTEIPALMHFSYYVINGQRRIRCTVFDLTEQKRLMRQLQQEVQRYQVIAEQSNDILFEYRLTEDTMYFSPRFVELTGRSPQMQNYSKSILASGLLHPEEEAVFQGMMKRVWERHRTVHATMRLRRSEDLYIWYQCSGTILYENDLPVRVVGAIKNVHDSMMEREELLRVAQIDSLTKLYNKEAVQSQIEAYLEGDGNQGSHGLLIVDLDQFKMINDRLGYLFGDAVLLEIASKLQGVVGDQSIVGRIGGDEFLILLKNCTSDEMGRVAQSICEMVQTVCLHTKNEISISSSIGISCYPEDALLFSDLFRKADDALYSTKLSGNNRYGFYKNSIRQITEVGGLENHDPAVEQQEVRRYANVLLVTNIIELLFSGKSIDSCLSQALSIIGDFYQVSYACIVECESEGDAGRISFEWYLDQDESRMEVFHCLPRECMVACKNQFNTDGIFCCYDMEVLKERDTGLWELTQRVGQKSILQCMLTDNGEFRGFLSLDDFESGRFWKQEDINSFQLISKTVGNYLIKYRNQQKSERLASIDLLTNVWNINKFTTEASVTVNDQPIEGFALLSLDIRKFRLLNDRVGYAEGDEVLVAFSQRLKQMLLPGELLGRVSGDLFVMLVYYDQSDMFHQRIWKLVEHAGNLMLPNGQQHQVAVNAGVYLLENRQLSISSCLDKANLARKRAKQLHKSNVVYFDQDMELAVIREKFIEDNMERALNNGEFLVLFQPKVSLKNGAIIGAEALIRWKTPETGLLFPDLFIPIMEKTGFIVELDFFVLDRVCQLLSRWQYRYPNLSFAVNFSRMHSGNKDSLQRAQSTLKQWNIPPDKIEIEITESAFIEDTERLSEYVHALRKSGFRIAMDDFGSGYSSLTALADLPVDVLKLDRAFLSRTNRVRERVVLGNVISMAYELGMSVVAEGVEHPEQRDLLREIGCEMAQGYLFARPIQEVDFELQLKMELDRAAML